MTELDDVLRRLSDRVKNHASSMATEEAVKTAVVLPFLRALGYDVFDPLEVIPEFTADAVGKKGEKVDYAIHLNGDIRLLIECKPVSTVLEQKHLDQLFRYFTVTKAKFAILTNGRAFNFYTDLDEPNKLDTRPFLVFDITDLQPSAIAELRKFEKSAYDETNILATAERLKYTSGLKQVLTSLISSPSDDFVKLVAGQVYEGRFTPAIREMLTGVVRTAFNEILMDEVKARLAFALAGAEQTREASTVAPAQLVVEADNSEILTTDEEKEGFLIVKALVRDVIDPSRIVMRDAKSYCAILVDNNNRKPLVRLHFNRTVKYLGVFDGEIEERLPIEELDHMFRHAARIRAAAQRYAPACAEG